MVNIQLDIYQKPSVLLYYVKEPLITEIKAGQ